MADQKSLPDRIRVMIVQPPFQTEEEIEEVKGLVSMIEEKEGLDVEEHGVDSAWGWPEDSDEFNYFIVKMVGEYRIITPPEAKPLYEAGFLDVPEGIPKVSDGKDFYF